RRGPRRAGGRGLGPRLDRGGHFHRLGYTRLSRRRSTPATHPDDVPGVRLRSSGAPPLLGPKPRRVATDRFGAPQRLPLLPDGVGGGWLDPRGSDPERRRPPLGGRFSTGAGTAREPRPHRLPRLRRRPEPSRTAVSVG